MEEHTAKLIKGPYRVLLSIVLFLQMANCNVVGQILSFFFVDPIVECDEKYVSETTYQCDLSAMCKDKVPIKHIDALTFKNWATTFELYCDTSGYKVIVQTIYFVASGLFPLCLSNLPDRFGRMKMLNVMMMAMLGAFVLAIFNYKVCHCISMFFCGGLIMIYNLESQIITEYYSSEVRGIITGIFMAAIPIFAIGFILLFYYVKDLMYFWYILVGLQVICILIVSVFFVESPLWYLSLNKKEQALAQLKKVAKINRKMAEYEEIEKLINEKSEQGEEEKTNEITEGEQKEPLVKKEKSAYNMLDVFRFPSTRRIVLLVAPYWTAVLLFDFTVFLNLEKSGSNVYIHGIVVFASCTASALISGGLADWLGRKKMLILSVFFSCIPYVFTPLLSQYESLFYLETALLFLSCISIETAFTVVIIYATEVFPTSIRSTASGCLYLCSRLGAIAAPFTVQYLKNPQYVVSGILAATLFLIWRLKETKGLKLEEDIEEKRNENKPILEDEQKPIDNKNVTEKNESDIRSE